MFKIRFIDLLARVQCERDCLERDRHQEQYDNQEEGQDTGANCHERTANDHDVYQFGHGDDDDQQSVGVDYPFGDFARDEEEGQIRQEVDQGQDVDEYERAVYAG